MSPENDRDRAGIACRGAAFGCARCARVVREIEIGGGEGHDEMVCANGVESCQEPAQPRPTARASVA
jgi:hypothetical protein